MGGQGAKAKGIGWSETVAPTIKSVMSGGNTVPDVIYAIEGNTIDRNSNKNGKGWGEMVSPTLNTQDRHAACFRSDRVRCFNPSDIQSHRICDISGAFVTLDAHMGGCGGKGVVYPAITGALCANSHPGSYTGQDAFNDMLPVIKADKPPRKYIVRRLTPLECCRLQGFPDWWEDGVEGSDSARYKMWGNGIALPCAEDVLRRIAKAMAVQWAGKVNTDL